MSLCRNVGHGAQLEGIFSCWKTWQYKYKYIVVLPASTTTKYIRLDNAKWCTILTIHGQFSCNLRLFSVLVVLELNNEDHSAWKHEYPYYMDQFRSARCRKIAAHNTNAIDISTALSRRRDANNVCYLITTKARTLNEWLPYTCTCMHLVFTSACLDIQILYQPLHARALVASQTTRELIVGDSCTLYPWSRCNVSLVVAHCKWT